MHFAEHRFGDVLLAADDHGWLLRAEDSSAAMTALLLVTVLVATAARLASARVVLLRLAAGLDRALPLRWDGLLVLLRARRLRARCIAVLRKAIRRGHGLMRLHDRLALGFGHAHIRPHGWTLHAVSRRPMLPPAGRHVHML